MDRFVASIKKKYQGRLTYRENRWPPCHSNKLIRLELVEKKENESPSEDPLEESQREDKTKRTPLAYCDIFNVEQSEKRPVRKVLVEGGAGIGKTTLSISISEDWANGKLFQQFELLLLLPLRYPKVSSARSLSELLKLLHTSKTVCESVVSYLEENEGENVLIIADGWDELDKPQRQEGSFLYELLLMELPFASVLVTSRSSASNPLRKYMDRFIDILGFNKENIEAFIHAEFADDHQKSASLSKELESNPLVESVCSVPLNCAIVCHLWRTLGEALPTTMTELYRKIILNFVLRNMRKADIYHTVKILTDFDSLPSNLQQSWWRLCEFAFQALIKNQIIFSQEDLSEFFSQQSPIDERVLFFGLLQPAESILETGCGVSYHFLHLTFQEYLAALHLVKHPLDHQQVLLESDSDSAAVFYAISNNFTMVWRFYFGIYFHESKKVREKTDIKQIQQHISGIKTFVDDESDLLLWHCAFEAKSEAVVSEILMINLYDQIDDDDDINLTNLREFLENCIDFGEPSNAYDCAAIIYAISNIQECNSMEIRFGSCGVRENQIQALGDILADKKGRVQIKTLDLSGNNLTDVTIYNLFQRAPTAFQSLEKLDLADNKIGDESIKSITTALSQLPFSTLSQLNLSNNPLGASSIKILEDAIRCDTLVMLRELDLTGSLTGVSYEPRATFVEAIAVHCSSVQLYGIDLSHDTIASDLPKTSTQTIFISKQYHGALIGLYLTGSGLSDRFVCELFLRASTTFQHLKVLDLSDNRVGIETIRAISFILLKTPSNRLETLNLSTNPLGVPGMQALEDAVCNGSLKNLQELNLQNSLTDDADINGALLTTLLEALSTHCPCFTSLDLSQNYLSAPGASALARLSMKRLTLLNLSETVLSDNGLSILLDKPIKSCYDQLILNDNNIHGSTISFLFASVQQLRKVNLSENPLGVEGIIPIGKLISCNLETLNLSYCQLTSSDRNLISYSEVIRDLEQQLCQMSPSNTLTYLDLTHNNFSEERIHILAGFMYLCPCLKYLSSSFCQINSHDLQQLLEQLSEFQASSPEICSKLAYWNLASNKIDDIGVSILIDSHLTSLLPRLGCLYSNYIVNHNPISSEMLGRLRKELNKRFMEANEDVCHTRQYVNSKAEDFQTQWEVIVALLYQTVVQEVLPTCPSIHLMVIGEEEKERSLYYANNAIHTETTIEITTQDDVDGPIPTVSTAVPHTMHPSADDLETIAAESQRTHDIMTMESDNISTSHSYDNEELEKADVNQPLVETGESSNTIEHVTAAGSVLSVDDLASVRGAVWDGRAKWYDIGLELGLTAGTLDAIQLDHPHDTNHCFRATLKEWLSRTELRPSWSSLAAALRAPPVGLGHLAEQLMANIDANARKQCHSNTCNNH